MDERSVRRRLVALHIVFFIELVLLAIAIWGASSHDSGDAPSLASFMGGVALICLIPGQLAFAVVFARFAKAVHRSIPWWLFALFLTATLFVLIAYLMALSWARYYFSVKRRQVSGSTLSARWDAVDS
jgi:hypothetical protein